MARPVANFWRTSERHAARMSEVIMDSLPLRRDCRRPRSPTEWPADLAPQRLPDVQRRCGPHAKRSGRPCDPRLVERLEEHRLHLVAVTPHEMARQRGDQDAIETGGKPRALPADHDAGLARGLRRALARLTRSPSRLGLAGEQPAARCGQAEDPAFVAFLGRALARVVDLFDPGRLLQLVERAVERRRPQAHLAVAERADFSRDGEAMAVASASARRM